MVQIKVTPEMLEEVANRANNTRIALESIHNNLCNEIDQLCFQWIGASNQQFVQMFNDARPKAFTSINSIIQVEEDLKRIAEKFRNTDNQDVTMEEGAMCGKPSSEEKGFDGGKLARDIAGEISGEYDIRRAWQGVDPSTGEKLSAWERVFAGGMAVAGLTPVGKIAKVGKGVKMTAHAVEAAETAKKTTKIVDTATDAKKVSKQATESISDITKDPRYYTESGEIIWPPNRGFLGEPEKVTLPPGTKVDRYGYEGGTFVSPEGIPYEQRALAPGTNKKPYNVYEVVKPVDAMGGKIAPWFGEPGLGVQYEFNKSIKELIEEESLRRVGSKHAKK
ncbi:WXG100 family type VII secretion target [Bacillus dicomae]|uniref:WXG100 family type VII secretion target n=1 Tax=Bacillus dicomae TaxID=3088378 RepID=A0AC61T782_9BACI|nr:WXG100 family type VII secretion target [Bacillus dicomae]TPV44588.1 WXG100 family type VII secretion target [Bacillus dicomae]